MLTNNRTIIVRSQPALYCSRFEFQDTCANVMGRIDHDWSIHVDEQFEGHKEMRRRLEHIRDRMLASQLADLFSLLS